MVSDSSGQPPGMARFQMQVQPINDAPSLSLTPNQAAIHGQGTLIPFTVTDPDSSLYSLRFQAWSSRTNIVANQNLPWISQGQFQTVLFIPAGSSASGGAAADYDGDGDLDLLLYNVAGPQRTTRLLRNDGLGATILIEVMVNWGSIGLSA